MYKLHLILLGVCLLFTGHVKANDTPESADFVSTFSSSVVRTTSGSISPAGDIDYYWFVVTVPGQMTVESTGGTDVYGRLYSENQLSSPFASDDDTGEGLNFLMRQRLAPGTYYLRVNHYNSLRTGAYGVRFSFTADQVITDDHGDSTGAATSISLNSDNIATSSGRISRRGDNDFFRIVLPSAGEILVNSTGTTDVFGHLLNSSGTQLAQDDDSGEGYNFRISRSVNAGVHFIRVRHYSSSGTGAYGLRVQFTPTAPPEAPNNAADGFDSAIGVTLPHTSNRAIERPGDNDYLRFVIGAGGGTLQARSTGRTDTFGELYNSNRQLIASNDDSAGTLNFHITRRNLPAGTYFLRVRHYSSTGVGPYGLRINYTVVGQQPAPDLPPIVNPGVGTRRAVVVGISDYQFINDLNLCDDDARAARRLYERKGWRVTMLLDSQATKAAILQAIRTAATGASDLIFHFSGHGTRYGTTGYICSYDGTDASSFISEDELSAAVGAGGPNMRAGIILDSCHSGEFINRSATNYRARFAQPFDSREVPGTINGAAGTLLTRDLNRNGWTVMTGCRGDQFSFESSSFGDLDMNGQNGHGWLSFQTISRLPQRATDNSGNRNNNGSIEEVFRLIRTGYSPQPGYRQDPQLFDGDTTVDFDAATPVD